MRTGVYQHYKGGLYLLLGIAQHTETEEICVVYVGLSGMPGPRMRVRPLDGPNGWGTRVALTGQIRFTYVGAEVMAS